MRGVSEKRALDGLMAHNAFVCDQSKATLMSAPGWDWRRGGGNRAPMEAVFYFILIKMGSIAFVLPIGFLLGTLGAFYLGRQWLWSVMIGTVAGFIFWVLIGFFLTLSCLLQANCL